MSEGQAGSVEKLLFVPKNKTSDPPFLDSSLE